MIYGLIRHARTQWNLEKKIQGKTDLNLCEQGVIEARSWSGCLKAEQFDLIASSPMIRAVETARLISDGLGIEVIVEPGLREQSFGSWEGKKINALRKMQPGAVEAREKMGWQFCPPGGESRKAVLDRVTQSLSQISKSHPGQKILLVTHSSVMKIMVYRAMGRRFLPSENPVLKPYYLHFIEFDGQFKMKQLNAAPLMV